ncbi:MAG: T9SS type A sorting domain-containing protein, partial [Prevotella sp.]|nr:T9SS type A sorting domain-containing protein [Prevotella sp.]
WRPIPFPTLAKSHSEFVETGGYWLGAVWAPTNYATIKGLQRVGADEFAKEASEKYIEGLYQVYLTTGTLWENYASEIINGNFKQGTNEANPPADCRKDFVGWTGLAPISILIENVLGFRLNGADKVLTYDLRRTDRHGIENLRMADITTSIIADDRTGENASNPVHITVTADKPYTLKVIFEGEEHVYNIVAGTQVIEIQPKSLDIVPLSAEKISIFPNPVKDELLLAGDFSAGCNFNICNIAGQTASAGILKNNSINVSSLPTGLYMLYLNGSDEKMVKKFLKQ